MSYAHDDQDDMSEGEGAEEEDDLPQQVADLQQASVPNSLKAIRACKRCGILKTMEQFVEDGCENCPFLGMVSNNSESMDEEE